jgi:hypothetical protein
MVKMTVIIAGGYSKPIAGPSASSSPEWSLRGLARAGARTICKGVSHEWEAMVPTAAVDSQGAAKSRASLPTAPALISASGPVIADRSIRAR